MKYSLAESTKLQQLVSAKWDSATELEKEMAQALNCADIEINQLSVWLAESETAHLEPDLKPEEVQSVEIDEDDTLPPS